MNLERRVAKCGFDSLSATAPFRPSRGLLPLPAPHLAAISVLVITAALLADRIARSKEWQGFAGLPGRLSQTRLLQRAAAAKQLAQKAEEYLRQAKLSAGIQLDPGLGPSDSPWIGAELTPLVTTLGSLEAKRIASNPDWARVLTLRLHNLGVRPGSVVAAGCSGSFPALNLALAAACQAMDAELIAVSSVTASTWGATQSGFSWPEIEARLASAGLIRRVSVAVSVGGLGDMATDLEPPGRLLARGIQASSASELGAIMLSPASVQESISERLHLYRQHARGRKIALYVNIGGTEASMGASTASFHLRSGYIPAIPFDISPARGVIARFAEEGVPTLSLLHVEGLAFRWGVAP